MVLHVTEWKAWRTPPGLLFFLCQVEMQVPGWCLPGAGCPYRVGTGTSVSAPSMTACCSRTKAMKGLSRKSTSPTSTLEASASRGSFFMNLFFSCSSARGRKRKLSCAGHVLLTSAPLCSNCAHSWTLQSGPCSAPLVWIQPRRNKRPGSRETSAQSLQGRGKHHSSSRSPWVLKLGLCETPLFELQQRQN